MSDNRPDQTNDYPDQTEDCVDGLLALLASGAATSYDESVSQLEHALQTATLAEESGATPELVTAALLHDIGHLTLDEHRTKQDFLDVDLRHERVAARMLSRYFAPATTAPIALHVLAKRYLVAADPVYASALSPATQRSLQVQGGPLTVDEAQRFENHPAFADAVALRRWDDAGKKANKSCPSLGHFRPALVASLQRAEHRGQV